ncbi:hypothetical protein TNCV_305091 [Trichonephila clavipes]|nr:hypothetical protein TNCV_305091 [Trichonephila clavipes]
MPYRQSRPEAQKCAKTPSVTLMPHHSFIIIYRIFIIRAVSRPVQFLNTHFQTTSVQASMCEWSSYPAGREMGLPRNIAIELGVQHCSECPHTSQSSCFQSQELTDPGQTTRNTPTPLCFHHQT